MDKDSKEAVTNEDSLSELTCHCARLVCLLLLHELCVLEFAYHRKDLEGNCTKLRSRFERMSLADNPVRGER